jgi:RNA polymerase sigma factor (sigma-70 family)
MMPATERSPDHLNRLGRRTTMKTRSSLLIRVRDTTDAIGWREFVELNEPLIQAYVRKMGVPGYDVDDAVQDILVRLLKTLPEFQLDREKARFRTWLWKVTRSTLVNRARRQDRRVQAEGAWAEKMMHEAAVDVEDDDWKKQYRLRLLEFAKAKVRERSHPRTWACFEEHYLNGRPSAEVASELGIPTNAVDVNSSRIMVRLRNFFSRDLEGLFNADDLMLSG